MAVKVLVSDAIAAEGVERLKQAEGIDVTIGSDWTRKELLERIGEFQGLIVRSSTKADAELIAAASKLKVIGRAGVGVDNIDIGAATKRGIVVINSPEGNTISTAEHTIAMMVSLARKIPQAYTALVRDGKWERKPFVGVQVAGKTLGILGLGRIGSEVARRAIAMEMKVLGYDPFVNEERLKKMGVVPADVETICREADFITVHTALTKQTEGLLGKDQFALMKPGMRIINCARGGIVDEEALHDAIVSGRVAGAALDVFVAEPPGDHPLLKLDQVVATPHLGASTHEAQLSVALDVVDAVIRVLSGQPVKHAVNAPAMRAEGVDGLVPYLDLAERLGHFFTEVFGGNFGRLEVVYRGDAARYDEAALTSALLTGMLSPVLQEEVNYVNAAALAEEREIRIAVTKESATNGLGNSITVKARTSERDRSVSGVLSAEKRPVVVEIDGYRVNVTTEGRLLVAYNVDRPGIIGRVGTLLGECGVNIAFMQVGRKEIGSYAVMVLGIDDPLDETILERLEELDDLKDIRLVEWQPASTG